MSHSTIYYNWYSTNDPPKPLKGANNPEPRGDNDTTVKEEDGMPPPNKKSKRNELSFKEFPQNSSGIHCDYKTGNLYHNTGAKCLGIKDNMLVIPWGTKTINFEFFKNDVIFAQVVVLPPTMQRIGYKAFANQKLITHVYIYEDATHRSKLYHIAEAAFCNCIKLECIKLPPTLRHIGKEAFANCCKLRSVGNLPVGLTTLGESVFSRCSSLSERMTIPPNIKRIPAYLFYLCEELTKVVFHDTVTVVGASAFAYATSLKFLFQPSTHITRIDDYAFNNCSSLQSDPNISKMLNLTRIGDHAFDNCRSMNIRDLILQESCKTIGNAAFRNCESIIGPLRLPSGLIHLGNSCFEDCSGMVCKSFCLPSRLRILGAGAFKNCSGLQANDLDLPDSLERLNGGVFLGCCGLSGRLLVPQGVYVDPNEEKGVFVHGSWLSIKML